MKEHLTSQQVTEWRSGVTGAEDILRLDDHLASCPDCRALVVGGTDSPDINSAIRHLRSEFSSEHLTDAQMDDYAASRPLPADVMQHLDQCEECRADAADLRKFASEEPPAATTHKVVPIRSGSPVWLRSLAAAVAVAALGLAVRFALDKKVDPAGDKAPVASLGQSPEEVALNIPVQYRDEVKAAMYSGGLHIPEAIAGMEAGPIQLRSTTDVKPSALHVISPQATAVVEDTPVFRWTSVDGASYTISIYDDQFHAMESASGLKVTEWRPDKPLRRGAVYRWEVRAVKGKHADLAPAPTEPEARFSVLGVAVTQRLAEARTAMTHAPLAMGILYADAGALDDAKRELADAVATNDLNQKGLAERLLAKLK